MRQLIFLNGNYDRGLTKAKLEINKDVHTPVVVICVHGLYGEAGDSGSKSIMLGGALRHDVRGMVYINTSRDWKVFASAPDRTAAFLHKTFAQERADVKDVIDVVRKHSEELFGIDQKQLKLWVVANSMGGSLISSLAAEIPEIEKICLCGSGATPSSPKLPILSSYPSKEAIRSAAARFTGDMLHIRGTEDTTVSETSQRELYSAYTAARSVRHVPIEGANHNFSHIFGKNKARAYKQYVATVTDFLLGD